MRKMNIKSFLMAFGFCVATLGVAVAFQNCGGKITAEKQENLSPEDLALFQELLKEGRLSTVLTKSTPGGTTPPRIDCPTGTSYCSTSTGGSATCCGANEHCIVYKSSAYCSPDNDKGCKAPTTYCGPTGGTTDPTDDTGCCDPGAECKKVPLRDIWYCDEQKDCKAPNVKCGGTKCCSPSETCSGTDRISGCYPTNCKAGESPCSGNLPNGDAWQICCAAGTQCVAGQSGGAPNCAPTPTPTASQTPAS